MEFVKVTRLAKYSADVYYNGDGFFYRADNSTGTRIHLKCISDKICKARASIPLKKSEWTMESFVKHGVHTHVPDPAYISVETLRYNILERCKSETTPFKVIYDEECARFPAEVSGRIGYYSLTSSMYRARRASQNVVIPQTLVEYGLMVEANERYCKSLGKEDFYRGTVTDENAGAAVIFASERFLRLLPHANELHMDATFKVVPSVPPCYQLFTIMAIHFDHAFPVISVVMERRTRKAYDNIFDFIKTIVPGLKPTTIMTDYEKALQGSVQAAFPDSQLVGCWFHVANAMYRKARQLGLANQLLNDGDLRRIVRMCMSLPLLPHYHIGEGFDYIVREACSKNLQVVMERFLNYINSTWIQGVGVQVLSVFGQNRRTNNDQESYHHALFKQMRQAHPNIWAFTDGMRLVENAYGVKYVSLQNGSAGARVKKTKYILNDKRIKDASAKLTENRYTIGEFLDVVNHALESLYTPPPDNPDDANVDDDISGPPASTSAPMVAVVSHGLENSRPGSVPIDADDDREDRLGLIPTPASMVDNQEDIAPRGRGRRRQRRRARRGTGHTPPLGRSRCNVAQEGGTIVQQQIYQEPITAERNDTELIRHPVGSDEDQPLPLIYREYRYKPVILSGNQLWPTRYIEIQKEELMHSLALSDEASVEWTISSTSPLCTMCEMNEANRLCSPCGHRICCGPCLSSFLDIPISMPVTNGNVTQSIPVRGPLCCPECRAVIGFIITIL